MENDRAMLPELFDLSGKVALVTGSRAGLGRAMAVGLAEAGAEVVLHGHHDDVGETAAQIAGAGGKSRQWIVDLLRIDELEARIEAVLRRASRVRDAAATPPDQIHVGDLLISQSRGTVTIAGQQVHLTPTEYRLLVALASRPDEVLSREMLGQLVWGYQDLGTGHLIDVHIGRLRLKLRRASRTAPVIVTVRGKGYTISSEESGNGATPD